MLATCGQDRLIDSRDMDMILVGYDSPARAAEISAFSVFSVNYTNAGAAGTILVARSKSDQEERGSVRFLAADTCRALRAWLEAA
jgi:hypothetical protein